MYYKLLRYFLRYFQVCRKCEKGNNKSLIYIIYSLGDLIVAYGLLTTPFTDSSHVTLKLSSPSNTLEDRVIPVSVYGNDTPSSGSFVGVLAASSIIRCGTLLVLAIDLSYLNREDEKKCDENIINEDQARKVVIPLAVQYSLVCVIMSLLSYCYLTGKPIHLVFRCG